MTLCNVVSAYNILFYKCLSVSLNCTQLMISILDLAVAHRVINHSITHTYTHVLVQTHAYTAEQL